MGQPTFTVIQTEDFKSLVKQCLREFKQESEIETLELKDDIPDMIDIQAAAILLRLSVSYIHELKDKNAIPYYQRVPKGKLSFSRKELIEWDKAGRPNVIKKAVEEFTISDYRKISKK